MKNLKNEKSYMGLPDFSGCFYYCTYVFRSFKSRIVLKLNKDQNLCIESGDCILAKLCIGKSDSFTNGSLCLIVLTNELASNI